MYVYAARQPILDCDKNLFAYELLFRDGVENAFPGIDAEKATSQVIQTTQFNDAFTDLTDSHPAFINFTLSTLHKRFYSVIQPERLVIEILESERPGKRLLAEVKDLKKQGYTVALDDYRHQKVWLHFFPFIDILKVDFQALNLDEIISIKEAVIGYPNISLLAEKIETYDEFEQAKNMGFTYFQGYFFAAPEMLQSKSLSPSQLTLAELLYETSKADIELQSIASVFERDVSLAYKLLRYSNSAAFQRRTEVSSIRQALIVLGRSELQKFLSIQFATQMSQSKPEELIKLSMIRARFCENIAAVHGQIRDTASAFLGGMMSLIDAILDEPITSIMEKLPLSEELKTALISHQGPLARYIDLICYHEKGDWEQLEQLCSELGITSKHVVDNYSEAIHWTTEQLTD